MVLEKTLESPLDCKEIQPVHSEGDQPSSQSNSGLPKWLVKDPSASVGDEGNTGSTPGSGRSPGVGNDNLLQNSCLANSRSLEESGRL